MFWPLVILVGFLGSGADIVLQGWSKNLTLNSWLVSVIPYLIFMTGLGFVIRLGETGKVPLTIAVLLVVVVNVAGLAVWDSYKGAPFSLMQWAGVLLALGAIACIEFGRA